MSLDYDLLCTIHRMLRQQTDLNDRLSRGPRRIKIAEGTEAKFVEELETAKDSLKRTRMSADQKQLQLREREAKIEDLKGKLNSCSSNREFQLLKDQIAADLQANEVLSDEILEQLEKIDLLTVELEQAQQNLDKAKAETKKVADDVEKEMTLVKSELERVTNERADAEKLFPAEIKAEYQRLVAASGESALASTDKQTCGNCCQQINTQILSQLLLKKPVFCQGCGSLMYTEESTAASS